MFEALGWSGRKVMCSEGASFAPLRELPESLKRGPPGGCLGMSIPCGGIVDCVFILRVQSFDVGVRLCWVVIDHA